MEIDKCRRPSRKDDRIIVHFDYDCFYAAVFEAENPALKSLPLAVQQKHIIVTCNYEARRRGLYKLQLITEAKRLCPEVIIVLGEDISRFRDASKVLYKFIEDFSWSRKVERLGFDEVWMDVTDMIEYSLDLLNPNDLSRSFFHLSKEDPTLGFGFDATSYAGHVYPASPAGDRVNDPGIAIKDLALRLRLGSHLAMHVRHQLESEKGYTSTVGISTNKILSKLVGNLNKPKGQTTLLPPYICEEGIDGNPIMFMDSHDIGKVPGIGFKLAQKLRQHVLDRPPDFDFGLVYGGTKENVTVKDVRLHSDIEPQRLEKLLSGPGAPHGIGTRVWCLLHGCDDTEVAQARPVPRQISIEDSYIRLDTTAAVVKELTMLSKSLLKRMRIDLLTDIEDFDEPLPEDDVDPVDESRVSLANKRWLAHPKTLRLSTRPKPPLNDDGTRNRTFKRISHSGPLPTFVFNLGDGVDPLAEKLVHETLIPMFRRLHPGNGWNISLVNIAVTNMAETAGDSRTANGRDIGNMFKRQEDVLKDFRVIDEEKSSTAHIDEESMSPEEIDDTKNIEAPKSPPLSDPLDVEDDFEDSEDGSLCKTCGLRLPAFALPAHERFHQLGAD